MTEEGGEPRGRALSAPSWRAIAVGATGAVIALVTLVALHDPAPPTRFVVSDQQDASAPVSTDPLMAELLRCRSLPAGSDDAGCRAAWEVNRWRFLGESRSLIVPAPTPPIPAPAATAEGH